MIIAVQGTTEFDNYQIFLRSMSVALSGMQPDDKELTVYSAGPVKVNSFVSEFCNLSERGMKARGKKIKFYKAHTSWIEENIDVVNYFAFLSNPGQPLSSLVKVAESKNIEVGIFRY